MFRTMLAAGALSLASLALAPIGGDLVGQDMPGPRPVEFGGVAAESFDDFLGQTVLVEFFAYW